MNAEEHNNLVDKLDDVVLRDDEMLVTYDLKSLFYKQSSLRIASSL